MSRPTASEARNQNYIEKGENVLIILGLCVTGILCFTVPTFMFSTILSTATLILILNGLFHLIRYFTSGKTRKTDILSALFSLAFGFVLSFNSMIPEWILRVCFGLYCLAVFLSIAIQQSIHIANDAPVSISAIFFLIVYGLLAFILLFTDRVTTDVLFMLFGVYFLILSFRLLLDLFDMHSKKYSWKRGLHVSLPVVLATLLPDVALKSIDAKIRDGEEADLKSVKKKERTRLKAMVHIGPEGFQKVGHFTFSWDGMVFSYGNYDHESGRFFGLLGDGVYFTVPKEQYLPNIVKYENNTIFEYAIATNEKQEKIIEEQIRELKNRSFRWYCDAEKAGSSIDISPLESDYPSRLHYRTGAKFYKIKNGAFKTYWVAGDNCVLFADEILGTIGADVLSMRGIITPGAYYDYLENEYMKENSPIVEKRVYIASCLKEGI